MPNEIPPERRRQVKERDRSCARCGGPGADWHHRRPRNVSDEHQHCSCNGVLLCRDCHSWVHRYPVLAKDAGMMVSRYIDQPGTIPVTYPDGRWLLDCQGGGTPVWVKAE